MEFRRATKDDIPIIRKFLLEEVYPDEPINRALNLSSEPYELQFHLALVPAGLSFVGFNHGELIGIALCGVKTLDEAEKYKREAERLEGSGWGKFIGLMAKIEKKSDTLRKLGVNRSFHCYLYGIKRSYRGEGLTAQYFHTMQHYVDFVKDLGFTLATGDTTNFKTAKLADTFGGILCYEFQLKEFVDENGRPYIDPNSKHKFIRSYAYWIEDYGKSHL